MSYRPLLLVAPAILAAGLFMTGPVAAFNGPEGSTELAQAPPAPPPPPAAGPERRGPRAERPAFNPKAMCLNQIARRAGNRTYIKVRLELKPEQMTAWDAFAKASDDADVKDTARCNALPTEVKDRPNYVDRLTLEENMMKARVERIDAVKPSLTAFYNTLSTDQKAVLDRPRPMMAGMEHRRWQR